MQRWGRRLACAACAALLAAGCGASGSPTASTGGGAPRAGETQPASAPVGRRPLDARAIARLGLIVRADVPAHVTDQDPEPNHSRCSPRALFEHHASGIATTPRYITADVEVQQSVLLFRDAAAAARAFARLDSPASRRCIRGSVREDAVERVGQPVAGLRLQSLTVEPLGQQSSSYRFFIPIPGNEAAFDVLANRIGRALSSVSLVWQVPSLDLEFQDALVTRIGERVRGALG